MIPLYGFLEGDTIGLLVLARERDTVKDLADKLQSAASVRVAARGSVRVIHRNRTLEMRWTVREAGIEALDRIDVVAGSGNGV